MRIAVDTSAVVAVVLGEPEREAFLDALAAHEAVISAGSLIETLRVVQLALGERHIDGVRDLLALHAVEVAPVDARQTRLAEEGMRRFGKGRAAPPAVLNFGDLFAYALARVLDAPLLFKGDDFTRTDVAAVPPPVG